MSVTFSIGNRPSSDLDKEWLNLCNRNAADLLAWLGLPVEDLCGQLRATELAARCRRRLWPEPCNEDAALPDQQHGGRVFIIGRPSGYLRERTAELLELAELAGDGLITWG